MASTLSTLIHRLQQRTAVIGVVGLGYVGLPLALRFSDAGLNVIGFDIDNSKIEKLNHGVSHIKLISDESVAAAWDNGFRATSDMANIADVDAIILCVPTPLNKSREPDLSFVTDTVDAILPWLEKGQVVALESTTYPGTTTEELLPRINSTGLKVGEDIFLVYSPEREDPGNVNFSTRSIPKICGGYSDQCLEAGLALYQLAIDKVIPVSSLEVAEMTKLLENIHRAVNIGLVNEMKIVADRMGISIYEVIEAAKTKPFGFTAFYPGPGLGGHCIPIDPFYLTWKARQYDINTRFIELAGEINTAMPNWVIGKVADALNSVKKSINGSRVMVLGIAYKKNVDDMRESPSAELLKLLQQKGAVISYSDPHVPEFPRMRNYQFSLNSTDLTAETLSQNDLLLLATDHDDFDYDLIRDHAKLLVDTRGRYAGDSAKHIIAA